ncbi:MAG TPA: hypothetical protein VF652_02185 [Allosphingosinicella sp.]|jgi:hypothetical protein
MTGADRPTRPAWGWRLLAWTSLVLAVLMPLPGVLAGGPKSWMTAAPNWIAIFGVFSYAYGSEPRFGLFWRVFALPFSFYTVAMIGGLVGREANFARLDSGSRSPTGWILVGATIVICVSICIALLRHARLLRGTQRSAMRDLEGVFA